MEQYINKQEVLDEIVNLDVVNCLEAPTISHNEDYKCGYSHALETVRVFLGTLEGKEVDLEKVLIVLFRTTVKCRKESRKLK